MRPLNISFAGSGNVAWHLAQGIYRAGHHIAQIYGRNESKVVQLASIVGAKPVFNLTQDMSEADMILLCVPDVEIDSLTLKLDSFKGAVVHTSGSVGLIKRSASAASGVMYPLQTFSREVPLELNEVPFLLEASNSETMEMMHNLSESISKHVLPCSSKDRRSIHLAAVWACNYANLMYELAENTLKSNGLQFELLQALIKETTRKALEVGPHHAQTGPAKRRDNLIIQEHLRQINDDKVRDLYLALAETVKRLHPLD